MSVPRQNLRYFLFSQHLADGVRITIEIILPVIICAQFGKLPMGFTIALGALCVSISDAPGPIEHKRNGMLYCTAFVFTMSLLTGLVNDNMVLMGLLIMSSAFFFTMFSVFGNRAASVGTAALLVMILRMSDVVSAYQLISDSLLIMAGGLWYMLVAMIFYRLTPYRPVQRSLGDCIHETAKFLRIKAELYNIHTSYVLEYKKLVAQQVVVHEKQDLVRELLFKNRELTKESTRSGKILILAFADVMDLYEQITASWYDYESLRKKYSHTGILHDVSLILNRIADELDNTGLAIQANRVYKKQYQLIAELDQLKIKIDSLDEGGNSKLVLKKILVNLRNLGKKVDALLNYFRFGPHHDRKIYSQDEYSKFVSHQQIQWSLLRNNFHLQSSVFRHSLRMTITCVAGYLVAQLIPYGQHSYWILLTIIIILKPGFGLTKQRNIERLTGTVAGGLIGIIILLFIRDRDVLFGLIIFFMLGTYTFQRWNYGVMVVFTTPYVIILFHLLGLGSWNVAQERLLDTGIASILAFMANYVLFPHWEARHIKNYMSSVLKANINYLKKWSILIGGIHVPMLEQKLVRKELYVSIANLSAAFHRMLSEPKSKQHESKKIYQFVVLNNVLSSNVAGLAEAFNDNPQSIYPKETTQQVQRTISLLQKSVRLIEPDYQWTEQPSPVMNSNLIQENARPDKSIDEQLAFIYNLCLDIRKITNEIKPEFLKPEI